MPEPHNPWPADHVERWPIERLLPAARNARTHSDAQVAQLAASIREWGWTTPVLVDEQGTLIAGHGRVLAARQLGITEVPTMIARGWTPQQIAAYRIADNKLALNAGWDDDMLRLELEELRNASYDLDLIGFSDAELADVFADPEAPKPSRVSPPHHAEHDIRVLIGDCREVLPTLAADSVHCVVTSPPYYGLRDYGVDGQIGLEATPEEWLTTMVAVFRELWRVMRDDATAFVNVGDSFSGKQLLLMPARLALALQADGWWLRSEIVWHKPNPMPESVTDRPTNAHEKIYLLTKSARYFYDADAVREEAEYGRRDTAGAWRGGAYVNQKPGQDNSVGTGLPNSVTGRHPETGRNLRNVWTIATHAFPEAHFATFPPELAERCIRAGTSEAGCCVQCGVPWVRETETEYRRHEKWFGDKQAARHSRGGAGVAYNEPIGTATTGWQPQCQCDAATKPCMVLDPFAGSGTTLLVADQLQCDAIGIELNPAYIDLAKRRSGASADASA